MWYSKKKSVRRKRMNFDSGVLFAFGLILFAGLATGIGSALAFFAKKTNTKFLSLALGFSAGVMIFISLDELLPTAEKYGEHHIAIYGLISGMAVMALSLLMFA
jgi:ZIP family zinc transporter